jgi:hypothetical protein
VKATGHVIQIKKTILFIQMEPTSATEDVLHIHSRHNGIHNGSEVADQLYSLFVGAVVWEPERRLAEVMADAQ